MAEWTEAEGLRAAWRALAGTGDSDGWKTIPINSNSRCRFLAGRRFPGDEEAILVGFDGVGLPPDSHLPQGHGFEVSRLADDPKGGTRAWLALSRRRTGSLDLFEMMADDLVRLLDECVPADEERLVQEFLARIRAWQDFMEHHRDGVLGQEEELGLFGEIVVLARMIEAGVPATNVLEAWQGPLDGLQDFLIGVGGVEVKATLSSGSFVAVIGSLEQLDETLRQPLFVAAVRLILDASGKTLSDIANTVKGMLGNEQKALSMFESRLIRAGLVPAAADRYLRRFSCVTVSVYPVEGAFPRLTRSSVSAAIRKARYEIELVPGQVEEVGLARALKSLGAM